MKEDQERMDCLFILGQLHLMTPCLAGHIYHIIGTFPPVALIIPFAELDDVFVRES